MPVLTGEEGHLLGSEGERVSDEEGGEDRYSHLESIENGVRERARVERLIPRGHNDGFRVPTVPPRRPAAAAPPASSRRPAAAAAPAGSRPSAPAPFRPRAASASAVAHEDQAMEFLRRKRQRLDEDLKGIGKLLTRYEDGGTDRYRLDLLEKEIVAANVLVEEVMLAFDSVLSVVSAVRTPGISEDRDRTFTDTTRWLREAKNRMRDCLKPEQSHNSAVSQRANVERVSIPTFSGAAEEFHEFRRVFEELTEGERYSPAVLLAQLRKHLPELARKLIQGYTNIGDAWLELERRYGSRECAIISAREKLMSIHLKGPAHEQVEILLQAVRVARASLRAVQAKEMLFGDYASPGVLVGKLPTSCQERWDLFVTGMDRVNTPQALGAIFSSWLDRKGAAAISARTRHLNNEYRKKDRLPHLPGNTPCIHCSQTTHLSADCRQARSTSAGLDGQGPKGEAGTHLGGMGQTYTDRGRIQGAEGQGKVIFETLSSL